MNDIPAHRIQRKVPAKAITRFTGMPDMRNPEDPAPDDAQIADVSEPVDE